VQVSHTPHHLDIAFDDRNLVAHAGLSLTSQLAARLGVRKLIRERLHLGPGIPGAAHADLKAMTDPGPAPIRQARLRSSPLTASSWRTCPQVKARRKVPMVEAAATQ
jgi:hypothetical protein